MDKLTDGERQAIKRVLMAFKAFWNAAPGSSREAVDIAVLMDSFIELNRAIDEPR